MFQWMAGQRSNSELGQSQWKTGPAPGGTGPVVGRWGAQAPHGAITG